MATTAVTLALCGLLSTLASALPTPKHHQTPLLHRSVHRRCDTANSTAPAVYTIISGTYNSSILTFSFDPASASITLANTTSTAGGGGAFMDAAPSWLQPHPTVPGLAFAGDESEEGKVVVFDTATLAQVELESSGGNGPAYVGTADDGTWAFAPNYGDGTFLALPLDPTNGSFAAANQSLLTFTGSGPTEYQTGPHPHMALQHPTNGHVFVPDLGTDEIHELALSAEGQWEVVQNISITPSGSGPRHLRFSPDGTAAFLVSEITSALHTFSVASADDGTTTFTQDSVSSILPPNATAISDDKPLAAGEVLLTSDGSAVYASNRDDANPLGDAIAIYALSAPFSTTLPDGSPEFVRTGGSAVRGMELDPYEEKYLIVANMYSSSVVVFERQANSSLSQMAKLNVPGNYQITSFIWL